MTVKEQAAREGVTPQAIYMRRWRARHPETYKNYMRSFHERRRRETPDHYGGKCICCGETNWEFLALDHKDGDGTGHRAEIGQRGANMIGWVIANDYPDLFVVRCHNCNQARGFYGSCPHERDE